MKRKFFKFVGLCVFAGIVCIAGYSLYCGKITVSPLAEHERMQQLAEFQQHEKITPFATDGCSGNVSLGWTTAVKSSSATFPVIATSYADVQRIPFEDACRRHDLTYYAGEGGYVGRLRADNTLRQDILEYAIEHTEDIKKRTGLTTDESTLFLYEAIADTIYRGVRLGGAPCSGESYAWGYGYGGGVCE